VRGQMIYFNEETGVGFIRTDEGERLYVPRSSFLPGQAPVGRCSGMVVEFTRRETDGGEHEHAAFDVSQVSEPNVGRARRRTGGRMTSR
jgi:cold shock CspA family protein